MYQEGGMVDVHLKGETIHTDESCTHGSLYEREIPLAAINPAAPAEEYRYHMDIVRHLLANLEGPGCRPLASSRRACPAFSPQPRPTRLRVLIVRLRLPTPKTNPSLRKHYNAGKVTSRGEARSWPELAIVGVPTAADARGFATTVATAARRRRSATRWR